MWCLIWYPFNGVILSVTINKEIIKKKKLLKVLTKGNVKKYIFALIKEREWSGKCDAASTEKPNKKATICSIVEQSNICKDCVSTHSVNTKLRLPEQVSQLDVVLKALSCFSQLRDFVSERRCRLFFLIFALQDIFNISLQRQANFLQNFNKLNCVWVQTELFRNVLVAVVFPKQVHV